MPCCLAIYSSSLQELAQGAKVEIQVVFFQAELLSESVDLLSLFHQSQSQPLDLVIRTSGEQRTSGFMLWEAAYSELYFTNVHWPDFDEAELARALLWYSDRERRFGK